MPIFSRCSDNSDPVLLTSWLARSPRLEPLSVFSMVILRQAQGISGHVDQFQFDGSNDQHRVVLYEIRETEILSGMQGVICQQDQRARATLNIRWVPSRKSGTES